MNEKNQIETVEKLYNWMPEWAKEKYCNCPIFHAVIVAANQRRLNREQTLWLLLEFVYMDRDAWKSKALEWISHYGQPPTIGRQIIREQTKE